MSNAFTQRREIATGDYATQLLLAEHGRRVREGEPKMIAWERLAGRLGWAPRRAYKLVRGEAGYTHAEVLAVVKSLEPAASNDSGVEQVREFGGVKLSRLSLDAAMGLDPRYRAILAMAELAAWGGGAPCFDRSTTLDLEKMGFAGAFLVRAAGGGRLWFERYHLQPASNLTGIDQTGMAHDNHPFGDLVRAEAWLIRNAMSFASPVAALIEHRLGCRPALFELITVPFADRQGQSADGVLLFGRDLKMLVDARPDTAGAVAKLVNRLTIHPQREGLSPAGVKKFGTNNLPTGEASAARGLGRNSCCLAERDDPVHVTPLAQGGGNNQKASDLADPLGAAVVRHEPARQCVGAGPRRKLVVDFTRAYGAPITKAGPNQLCPIADSVNRDTADELCQHQPTVRRGHSDSNPVVSIKFANTAVKLKRQRAVRDVRIERRPVVRVKLGGNKKPKRTQRSIEGAHGQSDWISGSHDSHISCPPSVVDTGYGITANRDRQPIRSTGGG